MKLIIYKINSLIFLFLIAMASAMTVNIEINNYSLTLFIMVAISISFFVFLLEKNERILDNKNLLFLYRSLSFVSFLVYAVICCLGGHFEILVFRPYIFVISFFIIATLIMLLELSLKQIDFKKRAVK